MTIILIILGSFVCIALLTEAALALRKQAFIKRRMKGEISESRGGVEIILKSWAKVIGKNIAKVELPFIQKMLKDTSVKLQMAGTEMPSSTFLGIQVLAAVGTAILIALAFGTFDLFTMLLMAILGFFVPNLLLNTKVKKRQTDIFRGLPDALDILTLLVEAGLDFGAALNILIEKEKGSLIDELTVAQQEIKLGANRIDALKNTAKRVRYRHLSSVINSLVQSMQTGSSIGYTLRALSDQYRTERALLAEKMGSEAPLKMMFPLILFIFPTIFVIIFGPLALSFMAGKIW